MEPGSLPFWNPSLRTVVVEEIPPEPVLTFLDTIIETYWWRGNDGRWLRTLSGKPAPSFHLRSGQSE